MVMIHDRSGKRTKWSTDVATMDPAMCATNSVFCLHFSIPKHLPQKTDVLSMNFYFYHDLRKGCNLTRLFSKHQLDKPLSVEIVLEKSQKLAGGGLKDVLISFE